MFWKLKFIGMLFLKLNKIMIKYFFSVCKILYFIYCFRILSNFVLYECGIWKCKGFRRGY